MLQKFIDDPKEPMTVGKKLTTLIEDSKEFIKDEFEKTGSKGFVLGLSGGLDSAIVLKLVVDTIGKDKIHCMIMPTTENENTKDAIELAKDLGVSYEVKNITSIVNSYFLDDIVGFKNTTKEKYNLRYGNVSARVRMTLLYDRAQDLGRLVIGTNNLSEYYTGYFTKWGDGASDLEPIMNFTKTELFKVAEEIGLPEIFYTKEPTADLWEGQTDEEEMGYSYEYIDELIYEYVSYLEYYSLLDFLEAKDKKGLFRDRHKIIRHKIQRIPYCERLPIGIHKWLENVKIFDDIEGKEEEE